MKEVYIHYGHDKFEKDLFINITNSAYSNKPLGGLWSCPTEDKDVSWRDWCIREEFYVDKLEKFFMFTLKDNARVLVIKEIEDLDKLPRINNEHYDLIRHLNTDIDFEALTRDYDAMMVYMYRNTDGDTFISNIYYELYGWDVDTLLVFNKNVIEVIEDE